MHVYIIYKNINTVAAGHNNSLAVARNYSRNYNSLAVDNSKLKLSQHSCGITQELKQIGVLTSFFILSQKTAFGFSKSAIVCSFEEKSSHFKWNKQALPGTGVFIIL